jgi:CheY-like chemotaxis protein
MASPRLSYPDFLPAHGDCDGTTLSPLARSKSILIVNPDLAAASVYQEKLEQGKFAVEIIGNPRLALRIIELDPVDLVVLDLARSGTDAVQFLTAIRSQPRAEKLPVVVVLNPDSIPSAQATADIGATRWISACECTPARLLKTVKETFAPDFEDTRGVNASTRPEEHAANIFFACAPYTIARLRTGQRALLASPQEAVRAAELADMRRQASVLAGAAGLAGHCEIAQLAFALEASLIQFHTGPAMVSGPMVRTLAQALDVLAFRVERLAPGESYGLLRRAG